MLHSVAMATIYTHRSGHLGNAFELIITGQGSEPGCYHGNNGETGTLVTMETGTLHENLFEKFSTLLMLSKREMCYDVLCGATR